MRAGVPSASFINLASIGLICKKQMHLLAIAIVPVTGVALQLEIGVTIREQCAALNDSLQIRLGSRVVRCVQEKDSKSMLKCF